MTEDQDQQVANLKYKEHKIVQAQNLLHLRMVNNNNL
jgi:hypothetical protein